MNEYFYSPVWLVQCSYPLEIESFYLEMREKKLSVEVLS
jgi:hypothetical protein